MNATLQGNLTGQPYRVNATNLYQAVVIVNTLKYVCDMNDAKNPHMEKENQNGIIHIRNWIRTNGDMSDDGKSITYNCKELEGVIAEALRIHDVVGRSEQLANFCTCKKPWGVGGRCVACEMPIKIA